MRNGWQGSGRVRVRNMYGHWISLALLFVGLAVSIARSDASQKFVGGSSCRPELNGRMGRYGIRLDKKQSARLEARTVGAQRILMIVQYKKEWDACGIVKAVIQSSQNDASFVFDSVDDENPGVIVVGTWRTPEISGRSLESWRVYLDPLKFVPISRSLRFVPYFGAGNDDGSDLADWARKREARAKRHSIQ